MGTGTQNVEEFKSQRLLTLHPFVVYDVGAIQALSPYTHTHVRSVTLPACLCLSECVYVFMCWWHICSTAYQNNNDRIISYTKFKRCQLDLMRLHHAVFTLYRIRKFIFNAYYIYVVCCIVYYILIHILDYKMCCVPLCLRTYMNVCSLTVLDKLLLPTHLCRTFSNKFMYTHILSVYYYVKVVVVN